MKKELLAVAMLLFAGGNLLAQPHVNDGGHEYRFP
jgi:alpha-D-xyloside xylohydrolase